MPVADDKSLVLLDNRVKPELNLIFNCEQNEMVIQM